MHHLNSSPLFPASLPPEMAASLSLQFLIQEWLIAGKWLDKLKNPLSTLKELSKRLENWFPVSLSTSLAYKESVLNRLCFYANILLENSPLDEEQKISHHLGSMKQDARDLKKELACLRTPSFENEENIFAASHEIYEKWNEWIETSQKKLKDLFNLLFCFLQEFKQDENLLFLLIEQKDLLNQYLGQRSVEMILSRLFPQGSCTLRETIYNGYARRGFLEFYSRNEELIESVDWKEDPCPPSTLKLES